MYVRIVSTYKWFVKYAALCAIWDALICICEIIKMPNAVAISTSLHGDNRLM